MKKRTAVSLAVLLTLGLAGAATHAVRASRLRSAAAWRTTAVAKGDLESVVSATGTLGAVRTVEVGTQVSGIVESLLVYFN
mgnify:CR=1 FL=1